MRRLVLGIAVAVTSLMPVVGMADDQQIADFIKSRLQAEQQQGNLKGFNVDMRVEQGTVWFKGHVSNPTQEMTILRAAQKAGHLGVVQVVDDIEVMAAPAQANMNQQVAYQQQVGSRTPARQVSTNYRLPNNATAGVAAGNQPLPFASTGGVGGQPMSAGYAGNVGMPTEAPAMPGYAWPGYAAHPNFGNVSYPQQYSPSAWPYIGPFYPYPQVPMGWRKVTLEWDDGWWMLDFHDK
ncbi:MAG: BON domain-containing protein [Planctomycetota bacterium]